MDMLGIGLVSLWVPLDSFDLFSDLACGEVAVGIHPNHPVAGVDIILGNYLTSAKVWKKDLYLICLDSPWQQYGKPDECARLHPKVFSSCAVTQARTKAKVGPVESV